MLDIRLTARFKRDLKLLQKQNKVMRELGVVVDMLAEETPIPPQYRDHALTGNYVGHRECHIRSDWLLIYKVDGQYLVLVRSGSHSELFDLSEQRASVARGMVISGH